MCVVWGNEFGGGFGLVEIVWRGRGFILHVAPYYGSFYHIIITPVFSLIQSLPFVFCRFNSILFGSQSNPHHFEVCMCVLELGLE